VRDQAGFKRCEAIGGCRPSGPVETPLNVLNQFGEVCNEDDQCCSGPCGTDADGRDRRRKRGNPDCDEPNPVCLPQGELCETDCECCGGLRCDKPQPDDASGPFPKRCIATGTTCLPDDSACGDPGECCNGVCTQQPDGEYRCGGTCVANGDNCTTNGDCCQGLTCIPVGGDRASRRDDRGEHRVHGHVLDRIRLGGLLAVPARVVDFATRSLPSGRTVGS
jgi:hypothetical protein